MSTLLQYRAGQVIFLQGYPADYAYIIQSGDVEIYLELPDKTEQHIATLGIGEMFGELGILDDAPRSASARALTDCELQIMAI